MDVDNIVVHWFIATIEEYSNTRPQTFNVLHIDGGAVCACGLDLTV